MVPANADGGAEQSHEKGPIVEVENLKTSDSIKFHMPWSATLQEVWTEAYTQLDEAKGPADELQCRDGVSLMGYLPQTLAQLRDQQICPNRKFQIRGATGGAAAMFVKLCA